MRTWTLTPSLQPILVAGIAVLLVAFGLAAGGGVRELALPLAAIVSLALLVWATANPRPALWILVTTTVFLPVVSVTDTRALNPIDILLPPALLGAWLLPGWRAPKNETAAKVEQVHRTIVRGALLYYGVGALSILVRAATGSTQVLDSFIPFARSLQGALLFYLISRLVWTREDLFRVRKAIFIGFGLVCLCNILGYLFLDLIRAGAVWGAKAGGLLYSSPNEAGFAGIFLSALILGMPMRRSARLVLLVLAFVFLLATASRSALLAWLVFLFVYGIGSGRWWLWFLPILLVVSFPILPEYLTGRITRTLVLQRGSFEAFSALIRLYAWRAAWNVFLSHPILGTGYLGFRFVSAHYNPLGFVLLTAESTYLETAAGMGIIGVIALAMVFWGIHKAGRGARKLFEPHTITHGMGRVTPAFLAAQLVANVTGDNLLGLIGVAQLAVFTALLLQSARIEAAARPEPS